MLGTQGNDMGFRFYQGDLLDGGRKLLADVWGFISPLPCGGYAGTLPLDDAAADATALRGRELKLHTHAGPSFRIDVEDACRRPGGLDIFFRADPPFVGAFDDLERVAEVSDDEPGGYRCYGVTSPPISADPR